VIKYYTIHKEAFIKREDRFNNGKKPLLFLAGRYRER